MIVILSVRYCWSRPTAVRVRVWVSAESATSYAISEPAGSNQQCGSDKISHICRRFKCSIFSDVSVPLQQCELCIDFLKLCGCSVLKLKCRRS